MAKKDDAAAPSRARRIGIALFVLFWVGVGIKELIEYQPLRQWTSGEIADAGDKTFSPFSGPPAPDSATALLGNLKEGDELGGWRVAAVRLSIRPEMMNAIAVGFENGSKNFVVWISSKGRLKLVPPVQTEGFAIYFGRYYETDPAETQAAVAAIVERVKANEENVPRSVIF